MQRRSLEKSLKPSLSLFLFEAHPFLPFQEISVLWHPGNEDSCYGRCTMEPALWTHTAHPFTIMCFHQKKIAIFKETTQKEREREGTPRTAHARSHFNQRGRPWGWLKKWRKKTAPLLRRWRRLAVTVTQPEKRPGRLYRRVVWWTCCAPTEHHSYTGRWAAPSRRSIYCCIEYTSKWSQGQACLHSVIVRLTSGIPLARLLRSGTWGFSTL